MMNRPCPACGFGFMFATPIVPRGADLGNQEVVRCSNCSMGFAESGLRQADYDAYYRERSKYAHVGTESCPEDIARHEETADWIATFLSPAGSVLDFGCANGILTKLLADRHVAVAGYDPSPEASAQVAARGARTISALADEKFDAVVMSHVLEHVYDVDKVLQQAISALWPSGFLYLEVPDASKYSAHSPFQDFNFEHINHFTLATLCVCAGRFGLSPLRTGEKSFRVGDGSRYHAIFGLFRHRASDGLEQYIERSRGRMQAICEGLAADLAGETDIIVWGAGQLAQKLMAVKPLAGLNICLVDSSPALHGLMVAGYGVVRPCDVVFDHRSVVVASVLNQNGIIESINKVGKPTRIITLRVE